MTMTPKEAFERAEQIGLGWLIEVSPTTGNRRFRSCANTVMQAVHRLGGVEALAARLAVEELEIHHWVEDHHVPLRYAKVIRQLTGWTVYEIQVPPVHPNRAWGRPHGDVACNSAT